MRRPPGASVAHPAASELPMTPDDTETPADTRARFKNTLIRVLTVQLIALAMLWLLQMRYHV